MLFTCVELIYSWQVDCEMINELSYICTHALLLLLSSSSVLLAQRGVGQFPGLSLGPVSQAGSLSMG